MQTPTPESIKTLGPNQVFVFGSNESGRHGLGAAKTAVQWGAIYGQGLGLMGKTFGIPTKDKNLRVLSLDKINEYVDLFTLVAIASPELDFLVTRIGCGLAGFKPTQIAPMFITSAQLPNVHLPQDFLDVISMH